jgi:hypothetical protein
LSPGFKFALIGFGFTIFQFFRYRGRRNDCIETEIRGHVRKLTTQFEWQEFASGGNPLREWGKYLQRLGVSAVELLPVFQFDAQACPPGFVNYWGYQPVSFLRRHRFQVIAIARGRALWWHSSRTWDQEEAQFCNLG